MDSKMEIKIETSEVFSEALKKLSLIQAEEVTVVKNATNPHFKNGYANLGEYLEKILPLCKKHNSVCIQNVSGSFLVTTFMDLDSGQFISSGYPLLITGSKPQEIASQVTYARRYSLSTMFMLVAEDDDANMASGTPNPKPNNSNDGLPWLQDNSPELKSAVKYLEDGGTLVTLYGKYRMSNVIKTKLESVQLKLK